MAATASGSFKDHPRKVLFRSSWAKPILGFIRQRLNKKLVYLGLPGFRALDILEWKEHLKAVIAFQCDDYDGRNTAQSGQDEMKELLEVLSKLEASQTLETFSLYVGYIEQVIMTGLDDKKSAFSQGDIVTIYNLDFCNSLTNPFKTLDSRNRVVKYYKLEVIDKLLEFERKRCNDKAGNFFVKFLTVNSQFWPDLMDEINDQSILKYIKSNLKDLNGFTRDIRLLKAYTFYHLKKAFERHGFLCEFLPAIYYKGSGGFKDDKGAWHDHWLLTFTIIGTPIELNNPSKTFEQDVQAFLESKFIFITDNEISCFNDPKVKENDFNHDSKTIIEQSFSSTVLWEYLKTGNPSTTTELQSLN